MSNYTSFHYRTNREDTKTVIEQALQTQYPRLIVLIGDNYGLLSKMSVDLLEMFKPEEFRGYSTDEIRDYRIIDQSAFGQEQMASRKSYSLRAETNKEAGGSTFSIVSHLEDFQKLLDAQVEKGKPTPLYIYQVLLVHSDAVKQLIGEGFRPLVIYIQEAVKPPASLWFYKLWHPHNYHPSPKQDYVFRAPPTRALLQGDSTQTVGELLDGTYGVTRKGVAAANHLISLGIDRNFKVPHNVVQNGGLVANLIPDVGMDDFMWLSNRIANYFGKNAKTPLNAWRLCREKSLDDPWTALYQATKANSGGRAIEVRLKNPLSGNIFWLGFNATR